MIRNKKTIIVITSAVVIMLVWAPWLDNQSLHDKIFEERAELDGTIDKYTGELICDYNVMWAPFGRWVASCEGSYYITFWDKILYPDVPIWKNYRDGKLGYEMKYPLTWSITEKREDFGIELSRTVFQSEDYQEMESEEYKTRVETGGETGLLQPTVMMKGIKLELLITEIPSNFQWRDWAKRATDYPYGKLVSEEFSTIEGKEIYERQTKFGEINSIVISFPGQNETKLFELILHTTEQEKDKNLEVFEQIISTFSFL